MKKSHGLLVGQSAAWGAVLYYVLQNPPEGSDPNIVLVVAFLIFALGAGLQYLGNRIDPKE